MGTVEERRIFFAGIARSSERGTGIVEHDLDMVRRSERPPPVTGRLSRILNWLMPSERTVGPPMRSVARELEEAYPARDL
jgi:hypothetical protein